VLVWYVPSYAMKRCEGPLEQLKACPQKLEDLEDQKMYRIGYRCVLSETFEELMLDFHPQNFVQFRYQ